MMVIKKTISLLNKLFLVFTLSVATMGTNAQSKIYPEWDGFQRSQESVRDVDTYFAQNGRENISILQNETETRVAVFSFDLSEINMDMENVELQLYNISSNAIKNPNLLLYAKQHDLASDVAPTWHKLDLSTSFGDHVVTSPISDDDQFSFMSFSGTDLDQIVNEAKAAGKKLALILRYPERAMDGTSIKFENTNAENGSGLDIDSSLIDSQSPADVQPYTKVGSDGYTLVFSDEFTDSGIDNSKWNVQDNFYRDRGDIKLYADGNQIEEKDGHMYIYYEKDQTRQDSYLAGRVDSKGKYAPTYGFLECKMHLVKPDGHQTAFWMMPEGNGMSVPEGVDGTANDGAEIDIIEGNKTNTFSIGMHYDGYGSDRKHIGKNVEATGMHDIEYHIIGFEWDKNFIRWYFNGEVVYETSNPGLIPHVPHFLYFSGSIWGNSTWVDGSIFTNTYVQMGGVDKAYIDWVRVYQKPGEDHKPVLKYSTPTKVDGFEEETGTVIYPNPASSVVHFSEEISSVRLFSYNGKLLKTLQSVSQVYVADLIYGIYFIELRMKNGVIAREKLLIL